MPRWRDGRDSLAGAKCVLVVARGKIGVDRAIVGERRRLKIGDERHDLTCDRREVRPHVDYFTSQLTSDERETALSTLMFYVGPGVRG